MATSAFGKAFAQARKAGDKEFTFNGKKYTTAMKDEKTVYPQVEPKPKALTRDEMKAQGDFDTSRKYVPRDSYVRSGQKSFDTEKEPERLEPDMSNYKPMREPKPLTEVRKPGTNVNYESDEAEMKRGGKVKASKMGSVKTAKPSMGSASRRGDGIAQRGKTKGRYL